MRLIIEIDNDVYDEVRRMKFLKNGRGSEHFQAKALLAIQKGDIVYSEEKECNPIEGVPLEELVS